MVLWACVNYGHAVFCTLSPSERQNHLACRLSRYRRCDPYAACDPTKRWCGADSPSLEPNADHIFDVHIPGFDARRILLAADPLAAVNAFFIQIRTVLATMLGVRMCPYCPHCNSDSTRPCQDALGSNAEAMGGIAGRVDAIVGAVEAQKSTGSLHFHYFMYVQRVHQYGTLKEIGEKLQAGLLASAELKHYVSNLCCESYPDVAHFEAHRDQLEKQHPCYSERQECAGPLKVWGDVKLGRVPGFVYRDPCIGAAEYKRKYEAALQYFAERCQHHIHPATECKKTGKVVRKVPKACVGAMGPHKCKHDFPKCTRVGKVALLLCPALARKMKLPTSGRRNEHGQTLVPRNNAWFNSCMPGLCVALGGSNSDVKPNDRLPIIDVTHEKSCKSKRCVKANPCFNKMARKAQRTQTQTRIYFGGYIGKGQPTGTKEMQKLIRNAEVLHEKLNGSSAQQSLRAVSSRLATDLEMGSTLRGAVEIQNLCRNLNERDVLQAECIRTFTEHTLYGRPWMDMLKQATDRPAT